MPRKIHCRARGTYGVGEPFGAAARVERTNSGDGILEICSRNAFFHGAGCAEAREEVEDMARERRASRDKASTLTSV
jgi:hypothetical protein